MKSPGCYTYIKRVLDIVFAICALILLAPVLIVVAALVRLRLGNPIFFKQIRPGLRGQPFNIVKFRTRTDKRDQNNTLLSDDERITSFGRFLRITSLDEFPELLNVIRGEMSLVGPRPLLMEYLTFYTPEQARRHEVQPGITGWAQVNGRNSLTWEEKFKLDLWYVENYSLAIDIQILWITLLKVIKMDGICHSSKITMPPYKGKDNS